MFVTWTALCLDAGSPTCPWTPTGACFTQAGQAGSGVAAMPSFEGRWWSVLAIWDELAAAEASAPRPSEVAGSVWHVVLEPASYRGDAWLSGGAQPFSQLPERGKATGAAAVITLAGLGPDQARTTEFFERFVVLGEDVRRAPGHRAALVQAAEDGAVLTFSAWESLRSAITWAYHQPTHSATVRRQEEHQLLATGGFLRCAVRSSRGRLGDQPDPMAGLTGAVAPRVAA